MKLKHAILVGALFFSACGKKKDATKDETGGTTETSAKTTETKATAKGRSIPNSSGLVLDAPAKWLDNGIGGAAGFHIDADGGMLMVREASPEEAAKPLDAWKKETEEILFQKWISADATPDGFKALYVMDKIAMKGDEAVKAGDTFAFTVRRKIGGKVHDCSGNGATAEVAAEGADLCMKIEAK